MSRLHDLAVRLNTVNERVAQACDAAGRPRDEVSVIAVTKTYPAEDVRLLAELGVRDIGENRHPEAGRKAAEVALPELAWHFVGGLQSNKAVAIAEYADWVHSLDRPKVVTALARGAEKHDRDINCLVQVRLSETEGRAGVEPADLQALAELIAEQPRLTLRGVMGVAPLNEDPRPSFDLLRDLSASLRETFPEADVISAGMSEDLDVAIASGATHLRIGRAILGERPLVQ